MRGITDRNYSIAYDSLGRAAVTCEPLAEPVGWRQFGDCAHDWIVVGSGSLKHIVRCGVDGQ